MENDEILGRPFGSRGRLSPLRNAPRLRPPLATHGKELKVVDASDLGVGLGHTLVSTFPSDSSVLVRWPTRRRRRSPVCARCRLLLSRCRSTLLLPVFLVITLYYYFSARLVKCYLFVVRVLLFWVFTPRHLPRYILYVDCYLSV